MAIFQCQIQIIKRSEGRSAVAAAAYRAAEKIENEYTGIVEDYSKKNWVEHSEIMLPENAPAEFRNRSVLWNAVEKSEKSKNARLAREVMIALPLELSMEENIRLVQEFVQDTFISDGMVADINIHTPPLRDETGTPIDMKGNPVTDKKDMIFRNPHAHILLTVRPLDQNGKWTPKTQKEYICRRNDETASFTAEEYRRAKNDGWEKQYQYYRGKEKVWLTPSESYNENLIRVSKNPRCTLYGRRDEKTTRWNSKEAIIQYRQSWEKHMNQALERAGRPERVDCRSYQEQGTDTISGIHLGSHASKDKISDRYRINEEIKSLNKANKSIRETLDNLESQITEKSDSFYESLAEQLGKVESDIISAKYNLETLQEQHDSLKNQSQKLHDSINRVQTARSNILRKNQASQETISRLKEEQKAKFPVWSNRPAEIQNAIQAEQDSINFREQRFSKILEEEGFSNFVDFQQESQILRQMESEQEQMERQISAYRQKILDYSSRYEELCRYLPKDPIFSKRFWTKKNESLHKHAQKAVSHIKQNTGHIHMKTFSRILRETDYRLNKTFYLASQTAYIIGQLEEMSEEQVDGQRHRRI